MTARHTHRWETKRRRGITGEKRYLRRDVKREAKMLCLTSSAVVSHFLYGFIMPVIKTLPHFI